MIAIAQAFQIDGTVSSCDRHGNGHINETYLVQTTAKDKYILQKMNEDVFKNIPALMNNVTSVTRYLAAKLPSDARTLRVIPTLQGENYFVDAQDQCWRMFNFIPDSICLQQPETTEDFYQSAVAFGNFQNMLADFPAQSLIETIPRFHDTLHRYEALERAVAAHPSKGAAEAPIAFALARKSEASLMLDMLRKGELPLRVTHNDTKLNNVMLDAKTRKALCVIDLDTVMPGLAANDFGDSIRFGASTAAEDEKDLAKVHFSLPLYEAYVDGFLSACGSRLTKLEIDTLPLGAKLMTLECGVRFLTDYLEGDVYFQTSYPEHNLDRCRTQFKLVADMENHFRQMQDIVEEKRKRTMPTP